MDQVHLSQKFSMLCSRAKTQFTASYCFRALVEIIESFHYYLCRLVNYLVDAAPKVCHACAESSEATCIANQISQTCATDRNSLGTTHCGSAVGTYRDQYGQVHQGVIRGCIDCAGN